MSNPPPVSKAKSELIELLGRVALSFSIILIFVTTYLHWKIGCVMILGFILIGCFLKIPSWRKGILIGMLVALVPFAGLGLYSSGKEISWWSQPAATEKSTVKKPDDDDADKKETTLALNKLAGEIAENNSLLRQLLAKEPGDNVPQADPAPAVEQSREPKTYGPVSAPEPVIKWGPALPTLPALPAEPAPAETEETEPQNGNVLPNISKPKEPPPELLVQASKRYEPPQEKIEEPATHVLCTCGRAHRITAWINGQPAFGPCYDEHGFPCTAVKTGTMKWK